MDNTSEIDHISDLLSDFSAKPGIEPREVLKITKVRYDTLINILFEATSDILNKPEKDFPDVFLKLNQVIHRYLFNDIYTNAGEYRKITDPESGKVYYGPDDKRLGRLAKFTGENPAEIESNLENIFRILKRDDKEPIFTAIEFYQKYVYVHPYYDGNGRIGRLLTSLYLNYYGYFVFWKPLEKNEKNKFITKLNNCHKQMEKPNYHHKLKSLHKFFEKFVIPQTELGEGNIDK